MTAKYMISKIWGRGGSQGKGLGFKSQLLMLIFNVNPFICWKLEKKRCPPQSVMPWVVQKIRQAPPTPSEKYNSVSAWGSSVLHEAGWGELLSPQHERRKKRPCFSTERAPVAAPTVNYHKLTLLIKCAAVCKSLLYHLSSVRTARTFEEKKNEWKRGGR